MDKEFFNLKKLLKESNLLYKYKILLIQSFEFSFININNDFLFDFSVLLEILNYLDNEKYNIAKFIFYNKDIIHKILYNSEELINLNSFEIKKVLNTYFYLSLLITDNIEVVNYVYGIELIKELNKINLKNSKLKQLLFSKILLDLIKNYEGLDEYDVDEEGEELNNIRNINNKIIEDNINIFNYLEIKKDINDIIKNKIDELYAEIITGLIKTKKINDYNYTYNIINQLDLENINITNTIFEEISNILNNNNYIKDYIIEIKEDLLNKNIINFYYILLKYILKNPIYIYQIPLLLKTRKFIIKLYKSNIKFIDDNIDNIDNNLKNKLEFIINFLLDTDYYTTIKLEEILKYYKDFLFKSKQKEINNIEEILNNRNIKLYLEYLKDYDKAKEMNKRSHIINYLFNNVNKNCIKEESEEKFKENVDSWMKFEKMIKEEKIKKMRKVEKELLIKYFNDIKNKESLLKIVGQEAYEYFIKEYPLSKEKNNKEKKNEKNKLIHIENENLSKDKNINMKPDNHPINNNYKINQDNEQNKKCYNNQPSNEILNKPSTKANTGTSMQTNDHSTMANTNYNNSTNYYSINETINKNDITNINKDNQNQGCDPAAPLGIEKNEKIGNFEDSLLEMFLKKSSIVYKIEKKKCVIDQIICGENNWKVNNNIFNEYIRNIEIMTENKNYIKFFSFLKKFEVELINNFKLDYNFKIKLFFMRDTEKKNIYDISCIYTFYSPIYNNIYKYIDNNILVYSIYSNSQGFWYMIRDINKECHKNVINQNVPIDDPKIMINNNNNIESNFVDETKEKTNIINNSNIFNESTREQTFIPFLDLNKTADKYKVLQFIKIVDYENYYNGFIKEINNGYYLTCKSDNTLILNDIYFNQVMEIKGNKDIVFNVCERIYLEDKDKKKIQLIASAIKELNDIQIDLEEKNYKIRSYDVSHINCFNCFEMKPSHYVVIGKNCGIHFIDLFNKNTKQNRFIEEAFFGGLRVSENILVITSNSIMPGGEDKLIFYNIKTKKTLNVIEGYSFVLSPNGLAIMPREEPKEKNEKNKKNKKNKNKQNNNRIVLCACKKYNSKQKNGILLVNPQLGDNKNVEEPFYETDKFEVTCFCPLLIVENNNKDYNQIDEEYKKNIKITDTNYFLVGGFDEEKKEGKIKLYKVNYNDKAYQTTIEYIQDIEFDDDEYKEMGYINEPINCIIQSKISGNIIFSSYNGKIYLMSAPNINYYLEDDNEFNQLIE